MLRCARRWLIQVTAAAAAAPIDVAAAAAPAVHPTRSVYMDFQATTPMDPRVLDAMLPLLTENFGNAHSRTHMYGWMAEGVVEKARKSVADLIGASPKEIFFTSGATESNNIAVKGIANFYGSKNQSNPRNHIVTLQTEHKCVLDSCRSLEADGFEVTYLPVDKLGFVDPAVLEAAIKPSTCLVSVMYVHNEIGILQDIPAISKICKKKGVFFHTDAAQALGKVPINVDADGIDLMSMSSHKIYGPKGIGALYMRRRPRVRVRSPVSGGGQERGVRSGTLASPLIAGFGAACEIAKEEMPRDTVHVTKLSDRLWTGLSSRLTHLTLNGDKLKRYPGNLNVSFAGVEGESLLMGMKRVAVSSGSACTSASLEPSYVLRAIGIDAENAHTSIRFGFGRFTTEEEVDFTIEECVREVNRLRDMSPLWDMIQDGQSTSTIKWT